MAYTRRQELMCTEYQMRAKPNVVLRENEAIYIKMNDGTLRQKIGDGSTTIINLPFTKVFDGNVVQTMGESETAVMSQKAVSDPLTSYNAYDLSLLPNLNARTTEAGGGVSFTWNTDKKSICHVEGTATVTTSSNIIVSTSVLPEPIKAGKMYYLHFITPDTNIKARIYQYNASGSTFVDYSGSSLVQIKSDTIGIIVRLNVSSGNTVNADVEIAFLNGAPNADITESVMLTATGGTDLRHEEIEWLLQHNGVCRLGAGDFYVGAIDMPEGSSIIGCGKATRIIYPETSPYGASMRGNAITMTTDCTVRDLQIVGSITGITPTATVGDRHGIMWFGNRTNGGYANIPYCGVIENVTIRNFTGGGITFNDTGFDPVASVRVSNCIIQYCSAGINIPYWAEFNTFTNVTCNGCYYGVVNNGGNNCFVNCGFNSNTIGFLIDNEDDKSPNNAHGSAVGCTINHNEECGVKIIRTHNGYVFTGVQMFDNPISIDRSMGIIFGSCEFGTDIPITVNDGRLVLFNGCMFMSAPVLTVTDNTDTIFTDSYNRFGEVVSN